MEKPYENLLQTRNMACVLELESFSYHQFSLQLRKIATLSLSLSLCVNEGPGYLDETRIYFGLCPLGLSGRSDPEALSCRPRVGQGG